MENFIKHANMQIMKISKRVRQQRLWVREEKVWNTNIIINISTFLIFQAALVESVRKAVVEAELY